MKKVVLYTCNIGGYCTVKPLPPQMVTDISFESYYLTNSGFLHSNQGWSKLIQVEPNIKNNDRMSSKQYRLFPSLVPELEDSDINIWIDSSIQIKSNTFINDFCGYAIGQMALFNHPDRHNIVTEAAKSLTVKKYEKEPIIQQLLHYGSKNFPFYSTGLYATGIMVRNTKSPIVSKVMKKWWKEISRWSIQDQISLPYVFWKVGLNPSIIPFNLWNNKYFDVMLEPHSFTR